MRSKIFICLVFVLALSSGMALAAGEEKWPTKPIEIIVGFPPGGPSDTAARIYAPIMSKELGVPVLVINKPGAGSSLAAEYIAKTKPDGYSLMESRFTLFSERPYMYPVSYTIDDFTYILSHSSACAALLVRKEAPWKDYRDFLEYIRKATGPTFGTTTRYNEPHICTDWIARREGVKFSVVPFKGNGDMLPALMGGHIDCAGSSGGHAPLIQGGRLRTIMQFSGSVADATKVPYLTEVYPDFPENMRPSLEIPKGLTGPKGIPTPVVQKLANALRKATESEEFKRYANQENYRIVTWDSAKIYKALKVDYEAYGSILNTMGFVRK
jgi:tripartite-type tricarboxylate transporter receptor subunit TctC